jgi:hypothetical protein
MTVFLMKEVVDGAFLVEPSVEPSNISMGLYVEEISSTSVESLDADVDQKTLPGSVDFPLQFDLSDYGYELSDGDNREVKAVRMVSEAVFAAVQLRLR